MSLATVFLSFSLKRTQSLDLRHLLPMYHIQVVQVHVVENKLWMLHCHIFHDDVIKWKHLPRYWPFVRGIHRPPVNSPAQRPVTQSFDVFFDLGLNKRLRKQSWGWWFETLSRSLWRHRNAQKKISSIAETVKRMTLSHSCSIALGLT